MKSLIFSFAALFIVAFYFTNESEIHQNVEAHQHQDEASIHSGRTDRYGGHKDTRNNSYHYHHGCGPHQHPNGTCKYNFKSCR